MIERKLNAQQEESLLPVIDVGGVPFVASNLTEAVRWLIFRAISGKRGVSVRLANAYCVALAGSDHGYRRLLSTGGVNFADGAPVATVMRVLARRINVSPGHVGRVRGPSFFEGVIDEGREAGVKHFFLGATPETLFKLRESLERRYPGVQVVGTYAPPFAGISDEFVTTCSAAVKGTQADIIWIGIGTPKQDFLSTQLAATTGKVCVGVGAAFDFSAGTVRQAPVWIQNSGFEWLFRFASEPKRLWRRYLLGNTRFLVLVLRENIFKNHLAASGKLTSDGKQIENSP